MKRPQPELLMNIQATPNEIIAFNTTMSYFKRYCKHICPVYKEVTQLLEQFQHRLNEQLPQTKHGHEESRQ